MDWKLEVVVVPVTDIDRAKDFYLGKLGFNLDADTRPTPQMRVVHMTPPGSACSVVVGPVLVGADGATGAGAHLQLVVGDIDSARAELARRVSRCPRSSSSTPGTAGGSCSSPTRTGTSGPSRRCATGSARRWGRRAPRARA